MIKITEATGATIHPKLLYNNNLYNIEDFGASSQASPNLNTCAINTAIERASESNGIEPEINPYVGLQDHAHSYFSNSLVYGVDLENIMIYGNGLFTGGRFDAYTGILDYILQGGDPLEPSNRTDNGHRGEWFGNKGIALVRCKNIVLKDFSITIGGHFALITEGCDNLYVDNILIDTTRDAFDIDCCQNVTVKNTTCNSLTDDGICLKASFGAGIFKPTQNILIEDCIVSGYDAGSVYAKEYTHEKLVAQDRCGPTARAKFGIESTCGYHQVTIRRVKFERSRGFALEAVDCSSLTDVIFEDCTLDNMSSSPIFIRIGDRGRFPVTGYSDNDAYPIPSPDVRIDNTNWLLPNSDSYYTYPSKRYAPHYNRTKTVTIDNHSFFNIIDSEKPANINYANFTKHENTYYLNTWDDFSRTYKANYNKKISETDMPLYANGIGCQNFAEVKNVLIKKVKITNADPRYPILLMGLTDSHIKNVILEDISVEYRGGLSLEHATEQRQLNTVYLHMEYLQSMLII